MMLVRSLFFAFFAAFFSFWVIKGCFLVSLLLFRSLLIHYLHLRIELFLIGTHAFQVFEKITVS